jgi:segregation and condensation protein A
MEQLPLDLYIPPDAMAVMLDAFEGPLDLLLYLIRKANVNVLDIPMAPLTVQYLTYVEAMRSHNLELAADYLVMAAMLIEIKSRMLLPKPKAAEGEEVEDPRAELVRRLIEYEQMKQAARINWTNCRRPSGISTGSRCGSRSRCCNACRTSAPTICATPGAPSCARPSCIRVTMIQREELSVREHMGMILRALRDAGGFVEFVDMFDPTQGRRSLVVHFLAMLELAREHLLEMTQSEAFAPIYVRLADGRVEQRRAWKRSMPEESRRFPDNPAKLKRVLEAVLLSAQQPLTPLELKKVFVEEIGTDVLRVLLDEIAR